MSISITHTTIMPHTTNRITCGLLADRIVDRICGSDLRIGLRIGYVADGYRIGGKNLSDWWQKSVGLVANPHLGGSDERSIRIRCNRSDRIGLRIADTDKNS